MSGPPALLPPAALVAALLTLLIPFMGWAVLVLLVACAVTGWKQWSRRDLPRKNAR